MEYYSKCNICGKITCYTDKDLKDNNKQSLVAGLAALSTIGNAVAGTRYDMYESSKLSNRATNKVVDYSKCPNCGSKDIILVTKKFAVFSNKVNGNYTINDLLKEASNFLDKNDFENAFCFATMVLNEDDSNYTAYLIRFLSSYGISNIKELNKINDDYYNNQHFKNLLEYSNDKQKEYLLRQYNTTKKNIIISDAEQLLKSKSSEDLIDKIDSTMKNIKEHDIEDKELVNKLQEKKLETIYSIACNNLEEKTISSVTKAKGLFETIKEYKDSLKKINICNSTLTELKNSFRKKIIIFSIIALICISIIVVFNIVKEPIQFSNVEKLINEKNYKEAYDYLIDIKDSDKKNKYLNEILQHGRYVIKSVKGTDRDTTINYEYDERGNPSKIVEEYTFDGSTKIKHEYIFDYNYVDNDVSKLTITLNNYRRDMKNVSSSSKDEYIFYNEKFDYEFTNNTSFDKPEYNDLVLINYIYIKNVKSINQISQTVDGESILTEFNENGIDKNANIKNVNSNSIEFKSDSWDWSHALVKLTFDENGLITECKNIEYDEVDYTITRKYKNGLLVNKVINDDESIYDYEYDSHNNFIRIREQANGNLIESADDVRDFEWEWINY